jgi:putative PIN family toxin of toxin-antitoxin system
LSVQLRLVLDTNFVLSALLWRGRPAELLDLAETPRVRLFASEWLIAELQTSLSKPRLANRLAEIGLTPDEHAANYRTWVQVIEPSPLSQPVSRDPDDDNVLACALAGQATAIATGDDDLLAIGAWKGIAILSVRDCLEVALAS